MLRDAAPVGVGGVRCDEISVGATPTRALLASKQDGITELRPGNYVYFDRTQVGARRRPRWTTAR